MQRNTTTTNAVAMHVALIQHPKAEAGLQAWGIVLHGVALMQHVPKMLGVPFSCCIDVTSNAHFLRNLRVCICQRQKPKTPSLKRDRAERVLTVKSTDFPPDLTVFTYTMFKIHCVLHKCNANTTHATPMQHGKLIDRDTPRVV